MTAITTTMPISEPAHALLRRQLRQRLLALPYRAFLHVVLQLLRSQGATAVYPAGRAHWKGRNHSGGWDAEAQFAAGPLGSVRCLIQAKQYPALTVHQRSVDELRGSCLRAGAQQALLVTLSAFSPTAQQAAEAASPLVPLRLMDGNALLEALITQGIGVTTDTEGHVQVDGVYFHRLTEQFAHKDVKPTKTQAKQPQKALRIVHTWVTPVPKTRSVTVIVRLSPGKPISDGFSRV